MVNDLCLKISILVINIPDIGIIIKLRQQLGEKIMINIINGSIFLGSNVIINGRVVNGGGTGKTQKFDEKSSTDANNVEKISIDSTFVDVNISGSNSSKIEAHFYGQAVVDDDVDFDVRIINRELRITLKFTGNCYNSNLKLNVTVPHKTFKAISAKSSSADITISEGVATDHLKVKTQSGDLETSATFANASITTMSGDVELSINASKDIVVEISTMSGNVSTEFNNIGHVNLSTSSMSGKVRNRHEGITGYTATVEVSTMSGDIKIR